MSFTDIPEELQGKTPAQLETIANYLEAVCRSMVETDRGEIRTMSDVEQRAFDDGFALRERAVEMIAEHNNVIETLRKKPAAAEMFNVGNLGDDSYADVRRLSDSQVRDRALRQLDDRMGTLHMSAAEKDEAERQVRKSTDIARRVLVTETPEYRSAFIKVTTQNSPRLTPEEGRALDAFDEYRAQSLTNGAGGYAIPVFIDPSIILTDQESSNPFLQICRQVTINTNVWKGVSSAGVSWSFDAEAAAVSDDSLTSIAQPTVPVYTARGYIPFSIEIGMDWPDFAGEMSRVLAAGYDELLVDKFTRGAGSTEPTGIVTTLTGGNLVTPTTDGAFGNEDVYKAWKSLAQKYRRNASWLMSVDVNNKIRQFGTSTAMHSFTGDLKMGFAETILGRPVYETPYMPDFTGTTGVANIAVVGDFSNYVIARNGGMSVELVPHVFDVTNNRPTGERGWFAYARIGGDSVNDAAFKMLANA